MIPDTLTREDVISSMTSCEQTTGMSLLDHGILVNDCFDKLLKHLKEDTCPDQWRLPDNLKKLIPFLLDYDVIKEYQIMHDCGKGYCLITDELGKRHFPNHAEI